MATIFKKIEHGNVFYMNEVGEEKHENLESMINGF